MTDNIIDFTWRHDANDGRKKFEQAIADGEIDREALIEGLEEGIPQMEMHDFISEAMQANPELPPDELTVATLTALLKALQARSMTSEQALSSIEETVRAYRQYREDECNS